MGLFSKNLDAEILAELKSQSRMLSKIEKGISINNIVLTAIIEIMVASVRPPRPGLTSLVIYSENNGMLNFKLVLPPPAAADSVSRVVSVKVGDAEAVVQTVDVATAELDGYSGVDNAEVTVETYDVDDAGNNGAVRSQAFVLTDTIAPGQPGEVSLVVTSEV